MKNQLGSLRYKEDVALGAITVFSNEYWWCLCILIKMVRPITEYLYTQTIQLLIKSASWKYKMAKI